MMLLHSVKLRILTQQAKLTLNPWRWMSGDAECVKRRGISLTLCTMASTLAGCPIIGTKYTVGGTVTGIAGTGLVIEVNSGSDLKRRGNGGFVFGARLGEQRRPTRSPSRRNPPIRRRPAPCATLRHHRPGGCHQCHRLLHANRTLCLRGQSAIEFDLGLRHRRRQRRALCRERFAVRRHRRNTDRACGRS